MIVAVADTHAVIWYLTPDQRLSASARSFMNNAAAQGHQVAVSSICLIEMVYLVEKGRIAPEGFSNLANKLSLQRGTWVEIPVDIKIAKAMARVDVQQIPDMPDRIVAATAVHLNVPLISRDGKIRVSSIQTIW